jgi:hypothetical protein
LPKARDFGESVATGAALPVPESVTDCGLVGSESTIFRVALRAPAAWGDIVRVMTQEAFPAKVDPHVVVRLKSPGLVPVIVRGLIDRGAVVRLVRVRV